MEEVPICLARQVSFVCFVVKDGMNAKAMGANSHCFSAAPYLLNWGPSFLLERSSLPYLSIIDQIECLVFGTIKVLLGNFILVTGFYFGH